MVTGDGRVRIFQQLITPNKQHQLYTMNPLLRIHHKNGGKQRRLDHHVLNQKVKAHKLPILMMNMTTLKSLRKSTFISWQ